MSGLEAMVFPTTLPFVMPEHALESGTSKGSKGKASGRGRKASGAASKQRQPKKAKVSKPQPEPTRLNQVTKQTNK